MLSTLLDEELLLTHERETIGDVLAAAAWIVGEYASVLLPISSDCFDDDDDRGFWMIGPGGTSFLQEFAILVALLCQ